MTIRRPIHLLILASTLLLAAPLLAQRPAARDFSVPALVVSGEGQVSADPDMAVVTLGASADAPDAIGAQNQVNELMKKAIDAIKAAGVPAEKIQTTGLSLSPVYANDDGRFNRNTEPRLTGYRASNGITIRLDDPKTAGSIIDTGIKAGANQLQGLSFGLKDDTAQREKAIELAIKNATSKAQTMAKALQVPLGELLLVTENIGGGSPQPYAGAFIAEAKMADTPIQAGQTQITATVTLSYRIGN